MKNIKMLLIIIIIFIILILTTFYLATEDEDAYGAGKRYPISVNKIEWDKLLKDSNIYGINYIKMNVGEQEYYIFGYDADKDFSPVISFFNQNKDKLFSIKKENTFKVQIRFYHVTFFDIAHSKNIYDNKKCTFYVDNSLEQVLVKNFKWDLIK